jgi:Fe-S cluster biogenesis protein NfuA
MEEKIKASVVKFIAPRLEGDGGWVEFKGFDGRILSLRFRGECSKCLILSRCADWIREMIKKEFDLDVKVDCERKRPYFQDV